MLLLLAISLLGLAGCVTKDRRGYHPHGNASRT